MKCTNTVFLAEPLYTSFNVVRNTNTYFIERLCPDYR